MSKEWSIPPMNFGSSEVEKKVEEFVDRVDRIEHHLKDIASSNSNILTELKKLASILAKR